MVKLILRWVSPSFAPTQKSKLTSDSIFDVAENAFAASDPTRTP
jgi:hypothetical protein